MKKFIIIVICLILTTLTFLLFYPNKSSNKLLDNSEELRGCWFTYQDWEQFLKFKDKDNFIKSVDKIGENLNEMKCNTLFLHLRAFGDAMYNSTIFPKSKYCYGEIDKNMSYDPLKVFLDEIKKYNIDVHGWINPMRTTNDDDFAKIDDKYKIKQWYNSKDRDNYYIKDQLGRYILIPSNPEVVDLINEGIKELLTNYELKGIHIDDYFYPTGVDTLEQNDTKYYNLINPNQDIASWRRDSTSNLVKKMYETTHSFDNVIFGVSPQANIENNYNKMFIDVKSWLSNDGYIDYIMPQIYYGFNNSYSPFNNTAKNWSDLVINKNIKFYVGLAGYKLTMENDANAGNGSNEWALISQSTKDILKRQEETLRELNNYQGYSLYCYSSFVNKDASFKSETNDELKNLNSLF